MKGKYMFLFMGLIGLLLIAGALYEIGQVPDLYQAVGPCHQDGKSLIESLGPYYNNLNDLFADWTIEYEQTTTIDDTEVSLRGVGSGYFSAFPTVVLQGRLIWQEDIDLQEPVAVINEYMSMALFRTTNALGQYINIQDLPFRVIGIISTRQDISSNKYQIFIPLSSIGISDTVTLSGLTHNNDASSLPTFKEASNSSLGSATIYHLLCNKKLALLPLNLLISFTCIVVLVGLAKKIGAGYRIAIKKYRSRLSYVYWYYALPYFLGHVLAVAFVQFCIIFVLYKVLEWTFIPLYLFPEWIPESFVDYSGLWSGIIDNMRQYWKQTRYFTDYIHRIRWFGLWSNIGILFLVGGGVGWWISINFKLDMTRLNTMLKPLLMVVRPLKHSKTRGTIYDVGDPNINHIEK